MSRSPSIEPAVPVPRPARRRVVLALLAVLAPAALAACGKRGELRLPRPDEIDDPDPDEVDPSS